MLILKYLPITFAALAIATPTRRTSKDEVTADTLIADIQDIKAKTTILRTTTEPYQGGRGSLGTALDINRAGKDVSKAIKQAIEDAEDVAPLTDQEAIDIGIAVNDLNPEVISTLDVFKSKRAAFDNHYHLSHIVLRTLEDQKEITQELSDAITAKVPAQFKEVAQQLSQPVLDKFDEVIAVYEAEA